MIQSSPSLVTENMQLKTRFLDMGLDLLQVWTPNPDDLELENLELRQLLTWVRTYNLLGCRKKMATCGFDFPPIQPRVGPDQDWLLFERWMRHEPLVWNYVTEFGPLRENQGWNEAEVESQLNRVLERLFDRGVTVDAPEELPPRELYRYLHRILPEQRFEFQPPNSWIHLLCYDWDDETSTVAPRLPRKKRKTAK